MAACRKLDLPNAPVVVRDKEDSSADSTRGAENATRPRSSHPLAASKARVRSPLGS